MGDRKEELKRSVYQLISSIFNSKSELEAALSSDVVNVIWQMPYDKMSKKEKVKFDEFFEEYVLGKIIRDKTHYIIGIVPDDSEEGVMFEKVNNLIDNQ